ncbi:MAG: cytochrome ubiquinol oxidase subunit I [Alphaproteobacteria bacterium]|nr:cytochrome ubiquinol oxidase subunit I [Alphaproteobacteria bacterium]OJV46798.1 MAG: cytochrome ubiquinol oxidase subunit I [Alphaproteobacteria bacterium 43-37]
MTTEILSRVQFAFTVSFHILFPALTIGLAGFLAFFEAMWLKTKDDVYLSLYKFWSKIFALGFGTGVVTGLVLSFEIGANFNGFATKTGNVLGPLLAYEVLSAFFLEAGFLGIMLFGLNRVGKKLHFTSTALVAAGTAMSAFWIIAVISWMQSPSGYLLKDGVFFVGNWIDIIFNPTFFYRFVHVVLGSYLTAGFVILGVCAYFYLQKKHLEFAKTGFKNAIIALAILAPLQIFIGDLHGLAAFEQQPLKVAAMEGRWDTMAGAPFTIFAIPDAKAEKNNFEINLPKMGSLILTHEMDGVVKGLKEVPADKRPNVALVFFSFRIMIGAGLLMLAIAFYGGYLLWRRKLIEKHRSFLKLCLYSLPVGFIATLSGWYVTEFGRQPWLVYGHVLTRDAVSKLPPQAVMTSLILFVLVYAVLLFSFVIYCVKTIKKGPEDHSKSDMPVDDPMSIRTPQGA